MAETIIQPAARGQVPTEAEEPRSSLGHLLIF